MSIFIHFFLEYFSSRSSFRRKGPADDPGFDPGQLEASGVNQYTVYIQEGTEDARSQKVASYQLNYEASGLKKKERYNFWVTASTSVGEGEQSKTVTIAPGSRGIRRIIL